MAGTGSPSWSSSTLRNTTLRVKGLEGLATGGSCPAHARGTRNAGSAGVLGEDRGHRRVDLFLGFRAAHAVETLLDGRMPQRLTALGIVQIHRNDAFAVEVGIPAPAPTVGIGVFHDGVRADPVAHQAVR